MCVCVCVCVCVRARVIKLRHELIKLRHDALAEVDLGLTRMAGPSDCCCHACDMIPLAQRELTLAFWATV